MGWEAMPRKDILSQDNKPSVGLDTEKKRGGEGENWDKAMLFILESHLGLKCYHYGYNFALGQRDPQMCPGDRIFPSDDGKRRVHTRACFFIAGCNLLPSLKPEG